MQDWKTLTEMYTKKYLQKELAENLIFLLIADLSFWLLDNKINWVISFSTIIIGQVYQFLKTRNLYKKLGLEAAENFQKEVSIEQKKLSHNPLFWSFKVFFYVKTDTIRALLMLCVIICLIIININLYATEEKARLIVLVIYNLTYGYYYIFNYVATNKTLSRLRN